MLRDTAKRVYLRERRRFRSFVSIRNHRDMNSTGARRARLVIRLGK